MDWPSDTYPREPGNGELYYMPPLELLLRLPQVCWGSGGLGGWGNGGWDCWKS